MNNLPDQVKFGLFLVALVIALVTGYSFNGSDIPKIDNPIQVDFVVQTEQKQPVEGAKIQFIFDGAPEPRWTNDLGYARVEIPQRDDIDIVITKKGFKTLSQTMNLKADTERTRIYQLEADNSSSNQPTYKYHTAQNEVIFL
ncbi:MAG: hypothetical protein F6K14_04425 [Symploca sp. SIO2C1]|nr:hypothetical protein [Symploca sp. SIO2C1]